MPVRLRRAPSSVRHDRGVCALQGCLPLQRRPTGASKLSRDIALDDAMHARRRLVISISDVRGRSHVSIIDEVV